MLWSDQRVEVPEPNGAKDRRLMTEFLPTERLRIYPHALRENNAYYDSTKKALLFGYFPARPRETQRDRPGSGSPRIPC